MHEAAEFHTHDTQNKGEPPFDRNHKVARQLKTIFRREPTQTDNRSASPSSTEELIEAAEQLKASLRDTLGKTNALICVLKRHRKEAKIVRTTLDSLRQLQTVG